MPWRFQDISGLCAQTSSLTTSRTGTARICLSWSYKNIPELRGLCGQRHERYDSPHPYQDQADWVLGRMEQSITFTSGRSSSRRCSRGFCPSGIYTDRQPPLTIPASHTQIPPQQLTGPSRCRVEAASTCDRARPFVSCVKPNAKAT